MDADAIIALCLLAFFTALSGWGLWQIVAFATGG